MSAIVATGKGRSPIIWGFVGFWFGIISLIVVPFCRLSTRTHTHETAQPTRGATDSRAMLTARHAQRPTTTQPAALSLRTRLSGQREE